MLDLKPLGIIQDDLVLRYLITSAKSLILNKVIFRGPSCEGVNVSYGWGQEAPSNSQHYPKRDLHYKSV